MFMATEIVKVKEIEFYSMNEEQTLNACLDTIALDIIAKDNNITEMADRVTNITFEKLETYSYWVALYQGHTMVECVKKEKSSNYYKYYQDSLDYHIQQVKIWKREKDAPDIVGIEKNVIYKQNVIDISKYPDVNEMDAEEYIRMSICDVDDSFVYESMKSCYPSSRTCVGQYEYISSLDKTSEYVNKTKALKPFYESPIPCIMYVPCLKWKYKDLNGVSYIDPRDGKVLGTSFPEKDMSYKTPIWAKILSILMYSGLIIFPILWFKDVLNFIFMLIGMVGSFRIALELSDINPNSFYRKKRKYHGLILKKLKKRYMETTK